MGKVTWLKQSRDRVKVYLDGELAFGLRQDIATAEGLCIGQDISPERAAELAQADRLERCLEATTRYLSYRPHSEFELRAKLERRGFSGSAIQTTMDKLKEQNLINDASFADYWQQNRDSFSPRSQRLTGMELKKKGVSDQVITALTGADDFESAYRVAISRARRFVADENDQRRLWEFLRRRGYSYDVIRKTVERIWKEQSGALADTKGTGLKGDNNGR